MEFQAPPYNSLPFIYFPDQYHTPNTRYWHVPLTNDYFDACCRGYEYALLFVKFLRDYPDDTVENNLLNDIVADINFKDKSDSKGYRVGFFAYLERMLYEHAKRMDFDHEWQRLQAEFETLKGT